jgi:serine/threonine protein kinase
MSQTQGEELPTLEEGAASHRFAEETAFPAQLRDRYRPADLLGAGGFGVVFKAFDKDLERFVAIKIPHPYRVAEPADVELYLAEGRALARLDHAGIVAVYDLGRLDDGRCFVVSKFVEGSDLRARMKQTRLDLWEAVGMVASVAEALHHAHQRGLVHRDIKPGNILLDPQGAPIVADFGLDRPCFSLCGNG